MTERCWQRLAGWVLPPWTVGLSMPPPERSLVILYALSSANFPRSIPPTSQHPSRRLRVVR